MSRVRGVALVGPWASSEVAELERALQPLPSTWLENNPCLRQFERRDRLIGGPSEAPGHSMYEPPSGSIVVFDKGVYHLGKIDRERFRRSIYHELAHSIIRCDDGLLRRWKGETHGDGFVDDYAKTSLDEDFCDSFSEFWLHRSKMLGIAPLKVKFISRELAQAERAHQEKTAMSFMHGLADELIKTARIPTSMLGRLAGKTPGAAKALGLAGVAGGGAYIAGNKRGEEKGIMEGLEGAEQGMQQAYLMGVQRGAQEVLRRAQDAADQGGPGK